MDTIHDQQTPSDKFKALTRRDFVKIAGVSAVGFSVLGYDTTRPNGVSLVVDSSDTTAEAQPSRWAVNELERRSPENNIGFARLYYRYVNHAERFTSVERSERETDFEHTYPATIRTRSIRSNITLN